MPSPKIVVYFCYQGGSIPCIVPPLYVDFYQRIEQTSQYMTDYLASYGFSVAALKTITQKLLAVQSGLALYGRNSLAYNVEFGSHIQILSFVSDLPCKHAPFFPVRLMELCDTCSACVTACPTQAIDPQRQLLDSDRCLTNYNEPPDGEFPQWVPTDAHNSLIGCMLCQDCCPANAATAANDDYISLEISFSEEETAELMQSGEDTPYSEELALKLRTAGLEPELFTPGTMSRNLTALFNKIAARILC
jgi:epoxyqueuosine reductase